MPKTFNKTLKYNYGEKSLRTPFVIYHDLDCLLLKKQSCQNNPNKSYTERKAIHEPRGYAINLVSSFDSEQRDQSFYRGRDCVKRFFRKLKDLGTTVFNYEQKEMIPLTDDKNKNYGYQKNATYVIKSFFVMKMKNRN